MQIEYINSAHNFLPKVKQLGKKNAPTLGFMPEGGFDDHAKKGCIIIAHNDDELCGYLMYRHSGQLIREYPFLMFTLR